MSGVDVGNGEGTAGAERGTAVMETASVTEPVVVPPKMGAWLVPVMVMVTVSVVEPSTAVTIKLSVKVWPAVRCSMDVCESLAV